MNRFGPEQIAKATGVALIVGAVVGLIGGIAGAAWILGARALLQEAVAASRGAAEDLDGLVSGLVATLDTSSETLASVEVAVGDGAVELARIASIGREVGAVVTGDVPAALDGVRGALPALEDSARVLDRTMRALRFVGVNYDADKPLDESIAEIDRLLGDIPSTLRAQADRLDETIDGVGNLSTEALAVSGQVGKVGGALDDLSATVREVAVTAENMLGVLDRLDGLIGGGGLAFALLVLLGGLAFSASQAGLWWWFRGREFGWSSGEQTG